MAHLYKMYHKVVNFFLFTSLFTAACVLALCMATERLILGYLPSFTSSLHGFLAGSTLLVYNLHYRIKPFPGRGSDQYAWVQTHRNWNFLFLILGLLMVIYYLIDLPILVGQSAFVMAFFSFAYSLPLLPRKTKRRLKDFGVLKIILLTAVWTASTALLPMFYWYQNPSQFPLELLLRFLFVLVLCLAFDIRDMQIDLHSGIYTLPNNIGLRKTYQLITIVLFLYCLVAFGQFFRFGQIPRLVIHLLISLSTSWAISFVRRYPSDKNYHLFIDGQMMLGGALMVLY